MNEEQLRLCPCGKPYSRGWVEITQFQDQERQWHPSSHFCLQCEIDRAIAMYEEALRPQLEQLQNSLTEVEEKQKQVVKKVAWQRDKWRKIANQAFAMSGGCIEGCKRAMMCTCGYQEFSVQESIAAKEEQ
jgi:hypothetical protein